MDELIAENQALKKEVQVLINKAQLAYNEVDRRDWIIATLCFSILLVLVFCILHFLINLIK